MSDTKQGVLKRGVTLFSYSDLLHVSMTLEDCFKDMYDMGLRCVELLAGHVDNYPNMPSNQWVDQWYRLCEKYSIEPGEMGHWYDTRVYRDRYLDVEESLEYLVKDFKIANRLGFHDMRTKLTVLNGNCDPLPGWQEYMKRAIELAEKYDVRMNTEVHRPTVLSTGHIDEYIEFIEKTGTKHFGFNIDFGIFQNSFPDIAKKDGNVKKHFKLPQDHSQPEELKRVIPYLNCCHAKFNYMDADTFEEITIPYREVLQILIDSGWSGCLIGEYEGPRKSEPEFVYTQLHCHQIMMKRIIGY